MKAAKQSTYKGVYWRKSKKRKHSSWTWQYRINGIPKQKSGFKTDREAAVALDKALIQEGVEPINIFIKK